MPIPAGPDPEPETFARLEPGEVVPGTRYRIRKFIGDGGMGAVYEAEHTDLERRVALKVLLPNLCRSPGALQMFRDEARTASKVGSDHIVELFDFAELPDGRLMFTMELLSGPTLAASLKNGPMQPARVIGILRQMCKGLLAAHEAGVVHRDIKPENIVLERVRGRDDTVKILDFGISTIVTDGQSDAPLEAGTPYYLAPELITGTGFDARADLYAVGCTAYEMLTGRPPFKATKGGGIESVLEKHLSSKTPRMEKVGATDVPVALEKVVRKALAKLPKNRYANMAALEAALCEAQIAAELQTPWDDLALPEGLDPAQRDKLLALIPDPRPRKRSLVWPLVAVASLGIAAGAVYMYGTSEGKEPAPTVVAEDAPVDVVQALADEAAAAAARSHFVYPPSDDPAAPTAYTKVRELETLQGEEAARGNAKAVELRAEYAGALVKLGDAYWENETGQAYAIDYYKQALCFDRTNAQAAGRTGMTPEQIEAFTKKAEDKAFTTADLEAAEPLVVLAEPDKKERRRKLKALRERRKARGKKSTSDDLLAISDSKAAGGGDTPPKTAGAGAGGSEGIEAGGLAKTGRRLLREGKSSDAKMFFQRALTYDPKNAAALSGMYTLSFNAGNYAEASSFARRLIGAAPGSAKAYIQYGDALYKLEKYASAKAAFEKAGNLGSSQAKARLRKVATKLPPEPAPSEPTSADAPKGDGGAQKKDPGEQASADAKPAKADPTSPG